jgi:uncharacterized low-complexity protein
MSNKIMKPLSVAVGVAFVGSLAISQAAAASSFSLSDLDQGYQLVGEHGDKAKEEGKCGEGKCGADKAKEEGKCGEGKCGADKAKEEGKCGEASAAPTRPRKKASVARASAAKARRRKKAPAAVRAKPCTPRALSPTTAPGSACGGP